MDFDKIWTKENVNFTKRILGKMEKDPHIPAIEALIYNEVANIWLVLAYLAKSLKVDHYAELGVRRGFSMAIVGARRKKARLVGFDMWQTGYGGAPNPGPELVRAELEKVGHTGEVELITGDCALTVPAFDGGPFPLVLVDAEHTEAGQLRDIRNARRLLDQGGYLVVDDLHDENVYEAWLRAIGEAGLEHWEAGRVGVIRNTD